MKKYLQLEGLVYKLVPIKTELGKNNPYLMGRIDSDLMYNIVNEWEWGNSDDPNIYHDPETRKNSISYRSNMARLAEVLIENNEFKKSRFNHKSLWSNWNMCCKYSRNSPPLLYQILSIYDL